MEIARLATETEASASQVLSFFTIIDRHQTDDNNNNNENDNDNNNNNDMLQRLSAAAKEELLQALALLVSAFAASVS